MTGIEGVSWVQIVDANWDQALYTAAPNATINVAQFAAKGSAANIAVALTPKGTGYLSARVPDGTIANGNARGPHAVDLQLRRDYRASDIASGSYSALLGGYNSKASGEGSLSGMRSNTAAGQYSIALGAVSFASDYAATAIGDACNAGAAVTLATGGGGNAYLRAMRAHGSGRYPQEVVIFAVGVTTSDAQVILKLPTNGANLTVRSNYYINGILQINGSKTDGSATACYTRQVRIRRVANNTTLLSACSVIGADDASGTAITVVANNSTESLDIGVAGIAGETWHWSAMLHGLESALANL